MPFTVSEDFDGLERFRESQIYIPLSVSLVILGFDSCIHPHSSYMVHIKNKFLDHLKYDFIKDTDYIFNYLDKPYEQTLSFSVDGFKKLSLVYTESPRYSEILNYFYPR